MAVPDTEGKKKKGPAREGCCFRACLTPTLEKGQPMMPGGSPEGGWGGGEKNRSTTPPRQRSGIN